MPATQSDLESVDDPVVELDCVESGREDAEVSRGDSHDALELGSAKEARSQ